MSCIKLAFLFEVLKMALKEFFPNPELLFMKKYFQKYLFRMMSKHSKNIKHRIILGTCLF